jgi:glutathione synthase/RimK-type ligase-like ATP-grasp enzyme
MSDDAKSKYDIGIVTCEAARGLDADLEPLLAALTRAHLTSAIVDWHADDLDSVQYRALLLRSPWDYSQNYPEFCSWLDRISERVRLFNDCEIVRWNLDKRYLSSLAQAGIPIVSTTFLVPGEPLVALPEADELVIKPTVSAGSRDTMRHTTHDSARAHAERLLAQGRVVMAQPYLKRVDEQGETALLFFDGQLSHTIRKGPLLSRDGAATNSLFAAEVISAREPEADELALARRVLAALPFPRPPLYARVDLLRDDQGRPVLLELELTEPSLFFATAQGSADRFVHALAAQLKQG